MIQEWAPDCRLWNGEGAYSDIQVRQCSEAVLLPGGSLLVYRIEDMSVNFAMFRFAESDMGGENTKWSVIFRGGGFSWELREMRHTWWGEPGEEGYVFYLDREAVAAAMVDLGRFFD